MRILDRIHFGKHSSLLPHQPSPIPYVVPLTRRISVRTSGCLLCRFYSSTIPKCSNVSGKRQANKKSVSTLTVKTISRISCTRQRVHIVQKAKLLTGWLLGKIDNTLDRLADIELTAMASSEKCQLENKYKCNIFLYQSLLSLNLIIFTHNLIYLCVSLCVNHTQ